MSRYVGRQVPATSSPLYCRRLVRQFIEWQTVVLSPICPHVAEHIWKLLGKKGSVLRAGWPKTMQSVDEVVIKSSEYLMEAARAITVACNIALSDTERWHFDLG